MKLKYKAMVSIKIKDPLFIGNHEQLVNIFNFNPKKLSIEKITDATKCDKNPFYLIIDNLKGYFRY